MAGKITVRFSSFCRSACFSATLSPCYSITLSQCHFKYRQNDKSRQNEKVPLCHSVCFCQSVILSVTPPLSLCLGHFVSHSSFCLSPCHFLFVTLSVILSVSLSLCLFLCRSVCLSIIRSLCQSVTPSFCLSLCQSVTLSFCLSLCLSLCHFVCLSVILSYRLSFCYSVCHSAILSPFFTHSHHEPIKVRVCLCVQTVFFNNRNKIIEQIALLRPALPLKHTKQLFIVHIIAKGWDALWVLFYALWECFTLSLVNHLQWVQVMYEQGKSHINFLCNL